MARIATWLLVDQPPPHNDGVTQLQPPPAERRKQLAGKVEQRQFGDVIPELEQTLARAAFWFDGQRLVASVLQAMGADYAAARDVVIAEVGHVLRRLPELLDLKFADGTPFADAQTRMWLQNEVLVAGSEDERGAAEGEAAPWDAAAAAARAALMKGDAASAFASFEQGLAGSSGRNRLCWRLSLASLLVQSGRAAVAVPLLEAAEADLQRVNLEEWEPNLCASLYRLLVAAYAKAGAKNDDAKRELAYARLCSLDPINAMQTHED